MNLTTPKCDRVHSRTVLIINACALLREENAPLWLSNSLINICTNDSNVFIKPTERYYIHVTDRHIYTYTQMHTLTL